jgi:hypothetical protein
MTDDLENIDAGSFQRPLQELAETIAQKVHREAPKILNAPPFVSLDMFVLIRQAIHTCNLLFYVNADERRENDCFWNPAYTFVTAPLVRTMIDVLYNITFILEDPATNGAAFRKSGFRKELSDLNEDQTRYGGQRKWDTYIEHKTKGLDLAIRSSGLNKSDILQQQPWKTLGKYLSEKGTGAALTPHQAFLKTFTYGMWREYSAMSHGGFEGLLDAAAFYTRDAQTPDIKSKMDEAHPKLMSLHLSRAALVLLCIITEVQAYFRFEGANIGPRIHNVWSALMPAFEVKELYDERYAQLMIERGIKP